MLHYRGECYNVSVELEKKTIIKTVKYESIYDAHQVF